MPRIDPEQLLTCLQVLLSPSGGILSKNEVQRLANLMTKFSKKLVSKCIYVLILKNTDRPLLGAFMAEGGWNLIHIWLQDANTNRNWPLVTEILELLLISPVDVERLKMNNLPKLIKSLTKRDDLPGIQQLATSLVEDWLTIVKGVTKQEQEQQQQQQALLVVQQQQYQTPPAPASIYVDVGGTVVECIDEGEPMEIDESIRNDGNIIVSENGVDTALRLKIIREGKKVISRVIASTNLIGGESNGDAGGRPTAEPAAANNGTQSKTEESEETDKENSDKKQAVPKKSSSSSSSSSSKSSNSSSSSRDKDKDKDRSKDRSKSSSSSSSSRSKSSSRDKDRDRRDRDRDKHRHNGSSSSSSSSKHKSSSHKSSSSSSKDRSKDPKEKQAEKDKDTLAKIQPQTLQKLGRIPKKSEDTKKEDKKDSKKSSFSVEVRKSTEEKPKTVKVYNSKMRSTGLLEEAKPPPPRSATKKTAPAPALPASIPTKRPSPIRDTIPPPEKKSRLIDTAEKGGIKLVPPKPKPAILQESDIFMDALAASATTKKEPKKRKRRPSVSKDSSPPSSPSSAKQPTSPTALKNITPANFYQDTLVTNDTDEDREKTEDAEMNEEGDAKKEIPDTPAEPDDEATESSTKTDANGLRGVLSYGKRKGPKRSIRWRPDNELVEVQYFELDETERVNVTKPFMDMQRMEMSSEREALRQRKLPNEDVMDVQTGWRCLIELELPDLPVEPGSKSLEKSIQFAREKTVLQAIYFNNRVPDCPAEPDHEVHPMVAPIVIPLEDPDHPDQDTPVQPWPEPKGSPPHVTNPPPIFNNVQPPPFMQAPPNAFQPNGLPQFQPAFVPPNLINRPPGVEWNVLPNGLPPNIPPPDMMQPGGPPMFDTFGPPDGFVPPFNGPNPMQQLFPPNNFNNMRGRGGFRRGMPTNNGPWLRMAVPNPGWNNQNRGRGFCNSFKKNGFCRNRDNCPYIH